jgi:hypothetical protein
MTVAPTRTNVAIVLALAFIVLNVVDIVLTWHGLKLGAIELNFLMKDLVKLGFFSSLAFKLGIASSIAAIMLYRGSFNTLIIGVSLVGFICIWNLNVITNLS